MLFSIAVIVTSVLLLRVWWLSFYILSIASLGYPSDFYEAGEFLLSPGSKQWTLIILVYLYNTCAISVFLVGFCESYMLSMQLMIEMLNAFNCSKTTDTHYKGFGAGVFTGQGNYLDFV